MKKLLSVFLLMVLLITCVGVSAEEKITVTIDGIVQAYDVSPEIVNGRTLVPMRAIFESLGAEVEWNGDTRTVTGKTADTTVVLPIDSAEATVNGVKSILDVPARIINSYTFVPARFVAEALKCDVDWDAGSRTVVITTADGELVSTLPQTPGEIAVIKRARQLTDFKWTPIDHIPYRQSNVWKSYPVGVEQTGINYSSAESNDKFITENVSFETLYSALANPDSVLYTKQTSADTPADAYYGMVCNSFVRYALGIKDRCMTNHFLDIPGITVLKSKGEYTVEDLKICDVLHVSKKTMEGDTGNHVALITDILKNKAGEIVEVEVSESVRPLATRRRFSVEDFYAKYQVKFRLCRYEYLEQVPAFDEETDKMLAVWREKYSKLPPVSVNYGNKSNYLYGEEIVVSVFAEGENTVQIFRDGERVSQRNVEGYTRYAFKNDFTPGYYKVLLVGHEDEAVEFCVVKPEISYTVNGDEITVTASANDGKIKLYQMDFRNADTYEFAGSAADLTSEEIKSGTLTRKIPEGATAFKVYFENEYGLVTHTRIQFAQ